MDRKQFFQKSSYISENKKTQTLTVKHIGRSHKSTLKPIPAKELALYT
jgi:hypothetical protein